MPRSLGVLDVLDLPVDQVVPELRQALAVQRRAVLVAEPGAGKTTLVPLRLLDEPWLDEQRIVVLEPRRLAARAAARRMAELMGDRVGGLVGFTTRDERRVSGDTRVEVVTEGILTRRLQSDPSLPGVGLVMFDEFHERNLQADLGLAFATEVVATIRTDLRILVASATIDAAAVSKLLDGAPVVESEGRTHPVDVIWQPRARNDRLEPAVVRSVDRALRETEGDVLVFLSGAGIIRRVEAALVEALAGPVDVRLLFGALSAADQDRALEPAPSGRRKVVLSTDIAETSLTVEGVTAVIDSGEARSPRFDARTGMTRLVTGGISRASADQRAGRAGRLGPGVAYRLWSKVEHSARRPHRAAEITQVDLAGFVLETLSWGAADPADLELLDSPPSAALSEARALLTMLGALDDEGVLTALGQRLAAIPLHPRLGRVVIAADDSGCGWLGCLIAASLDDRDVLRGRPDELPADLGLRLDLLADPGRRHPAADGGAIRWARQRAEQLAKRLGIATTSADSRLAGALLVAGFPDRLAKARGSGRGRFRLRSGTGAWVAESDVLAGEELLVVADLDGNRKEGRVRIAAPVDLADLDHLGAEVERVEALRWDRHRNDLVLRVERRLGGIELASSDERPEPGPATIVALVERARTTRLSDLGWDSAGRGLQQRLGFVRHHDGGDWPDVSEAALMDTLDAWLPPFLAGARGRADLRRLDMAMVIGTQLGFDAATELDRLAPRTVGLPSGRTVVLDYSSGELAVVSVRVQELYGSTVTPSVLEGRLPLTFELLSPANRPIQITSDLAGFWDGTWADVRKDMLAQYPKHDWPAEPATATPSKPGDRPHRGR